MMRLIPHMTFFVLALCVCRSSSSVPDASVRDTSTPKLVTPRAPATAGETPLDLFLSKLTLTMIKDHDAPVTATVRLRDGAISLFGTPPSARLSAELDSFDSAIAMRDERVRNIFFETSAKGWENAEIVIAAIPQSILDALHKDKRAHGEIEGTLKLHDHTAKLNMSVDVVDKGGGRVWVKTTTPVIVKISEVGLSDNLRRLSAICMHDSVDDIVKVDASLEFAL